MISDDESSARIGNVDRMHGARTVAEFVCSLFVSIVMFAAIVLLEPIVEMLF